MKTVFCLFRDMEDAKAAIDELVEKRFPGGEMNIVVQAQTARNFLDINPRSTNIPVTGNGSGNHFPVLNKMLHGKQPINLPDTGRVFAVGEIASIMTRTASASVNSDIEGGLKAALIDLGVSEKLAIQFYRGIKEGGTLFFLRTADERSSELASIFRSQDGNNLVGSV